MRRCAAALSQLCAWRGRGAVGVVPYLGQACSRNEKPACSRPLCSQTSPSQTVWSDVSEALRAKSTHMRVRGTICRSCQGTGTTCSGRPQAQRAHRAWKHSLMVVACVSAQQALPPAYLLWCLESPRHASSYTTRPRPPPVAEMLAGASSWCAKGHEGRSPHTSQPQKCSQWILPDPPTSLCAIGSSYLAAPGTPRRW